MNKRLLLYVHFNRDNKLSPHVVYQLQQLRGLFGEVFFISNSVLSSEDLKIIKEKNLIDGFMQRKNQGYDFVAWAEAMKKYGFDKLADYDSVTLMNDTCFGPIYDFGAPFERMDTNVQIDFWGITNNRSHKVKPWADRSEVVLPDHIQSYFVSYKQKIVKSDTFKNFWENVTVLDDVVEVIVKYETAMTKYFEDAGFKSAVLFDTRKENWTGMMVHDFSVFNMPELLKRHIPFLKIKAFTYGADNIYTPLVMERIKQETNYPVRFIVDHMTDVDYPDREYMLAEKTRIFKDDSTVTGNLKVGIHLHAFYLDLIPEYIEYFRTYVKNYDLYITTDSEKKKLKIEENYKLPELKRVIATGNKGRDVLPWMIISKEMKNYELIGHFHTKKSKDNDWIVGESWRRDIEYSLLKPAQQIFEEFERNPKLGLMIADVPSFFEHFYGPTYITERDIWQDMEQIWNKIDFINPKELKQKDSYVMSYGTMLWYRPEALQNLLDIDIIEDIPEEPLPYNSILHAFERLVVYVAWANGYDFEISQIQTNNGFISNYSANRLLRAVETDLTQTKLRDLIKMTLRKIRVILKYRLTGKG
ncbi:lipopolysaccharide biosynthesis protein [Lactococcus taiwanensis]|uniref:Lipopolysaccharide biosynthesis protein n=1 Tax=Lactococcus taiwanensis TaxID=1151742 RepID=A0AA45KI92_9LACT|nr:rhamnan synthesis F family protein [Lactococcus taiwanensis]QSE77058.1 lipopolysaccharide biosynthesis protein [Lactococcus taiwanensis]